MGDVLVAVKNNKLFETLANACRDRGFAAVRAQNLDEAEAMLPEGRYSALIVNLDELQTASEKKIAARIRELPPAMKLLGLGAGATLKTVTGYIRAGLNDFLPLPPDPLELAQALTNMLGSFADATGQGAQAAFAAPRSPSAPPQSGPSAASGTSAASSSPLASPVSPSSASPVSGGAALPNATGAHEATAASGGDGGGGRHPGQDPALAAVVFPSRAIVGQSPALMKLFRIIAKVAATDSTVMVHGETGTGKELIARAIHLSSPRKDKPMVPVNCGAIPEELLETELFGHEKGAFTNAVKERAGRFELAQGGTVFLDEIGDMSPKLQVKLLRVLQEHEFEKVGGERTIRADIRVITATHVDLAKAVREGRFREDLYYRLNVIPVSVPPLRDRAADIPLLIEFFLKRLRETRGSSVVGVDPPALAQLCSYRWPGNIRELENLMERMVILADGNVLTEEDLPTWIRSVPDPADEARDELLKGFMLADDDLPPGPAGSPDQQPDAARGPGGSGFADSCPGLTPAAVSPPGARPPSIPDGGPGAWAEAGNAAPSCPSAPPLPESCQAPAGGGLGPGDEALSGTEIAPNPAGVIRPAAGGDPSAQGNPEASARPLPDELAAVVSPLLRFPLDGVSLNALMKDYEAKLITAALQASGGLKNNAAKLLGINRTTLQEKIRKK
ncbi:MAG: sigma 54-interacting transcriptional regulator [Deltaproteobacteria bacterium]|jgi:DNA-binding NtrC family response regulator|nr:sigma 54-interacting transcriptional regulator [Deltaproteobacteria bacterium]